MSVGHSKYSEEIKQPNLKEILKHHMSICKNILSKPYVDNRYLCIDATAGSGMVEGCKGSPLIFLEVAEQIGIPFQGIFIEKDREICESLEVCVSTYTNCVCHNMDNAEIIVNYPKSRKKRYGLLYFDPNGHKGIPSKEDLKVFIDKHPKMDILIHFSPASMKRCHNSFIIDELLGLKEWQYLRQVHTGWQWTYMFLTGWGGFQNKFKKISLFPQTCLEFKETYKVIKSTKEERFYAGNIFDTCSEDRPRINI
jgi:three-Cys-motif partner protein